MPDGSQLADGRWPVDRGMPLQVPKSDSGQAAATEPAVFEIALSKAAGRRHRRARGRPVRPFARQQRPARSQDDRSDRAYRSQVVGIFEPNDPDRRHLVGQRTAPAVTTSRVPTASGDLRDRVRGPEEYPRLAASTCRSTTTGTFQVDPAGSTPTGRDARHGPPAARSQHPPKDSRFLKSTGSTVASPTSRSGHGLPRIFDSLRRSARAD